MPIVVDPTVGGGSSNALQSVEDVSARLSTRLDVDAWEGAGPDLQAKAAIEATREIGTMRFLGQKASGEQSLAWPRVHVPDPDPGPGGGRFLPGDAIPDAVLEAHAEACLTLLQLRDMGIPMHGGGVVEPQLKRRKTDVIEREWFELDREEVPEGLAKSPRAIVLLLPFLEAAGGEVTRC